MISVHFQGKPFNITVIQVYAPTGIAEAAEVEWFYKDLQDLLELISKKDDLSFIGNWNAKVWSQELPGVTGVFGPGVHNEAGQRLTEFCQREHLVIAWNRSVFIQIQNPLPTTREKTLCMNITRCSIPKSDRLYSLQPKMRKLYTVNKNKTGSWLAQIMNSLLPNSDLNWRK